MKNHQVVFILISTQRVASVVQLMSFIIDCKETIYGARVNSYQVNVSESLSNPVPSRIQPAAFQLKIRGFRWNMLKKNNSECWIYARIHYQSLT
jgi:hypothetical protein